MGGRDRDETVGAVPVVEEDLRVGTEEVATETVRIRTAVHEDEHVIDEPVRHKRVEVTRVPVDRVVDQPLSDRREGDTLIMSLHEEIITIQKKYHIIEEIHVRTYYEEELHHEVVRTRRSTVSVSRD